MSGIETAGAVSGCVSVSGYGVNGSGLKKGPPVVFDGPGVYRDAVGVIIEARLDHHDNLDYFVAGSDDCYSPGDFVGPLVKLSAPAPKAAEPTTAPPAVAPPRADLKLDLACGQRPEPGWTGVDLHAAGAEKVDLTKFPWPFPDQSAVEIRCNHFVEHLPMVEVEHEGRTKDLLFAFFDEMYRVAAPGCRVTIVVPHCQSRRAFWDPTHRRFLAPETFLYLNLDWRKLQGLDHYPVDCNWVIVNVVPSYSTDENVRAAEVVTKRLNECWNVAIDIHATLLKPGGHTLKPEPTPGQP
jgi:hypothetical protein